MPTAFPFHPRSILSSNKHNSRTHVQFPHNSTCVYSSRLEHNTTLLDKTIHIAKQRHPLTHNTALLQQRNVYTSHPTVSATLQHNRFKAAQRRSFSTHRLQLAQLRNVYASLHALTLTLHHKHPLLSLLVRAKRVLSHGHRRERRQIYCSHEGCVPTFQRHALTAREAVGANGEDGERVQI